MHPEVASALLDHALPLRERDDIKFAEPWEARAFAIVLQLSKDGHFAWSEWVEYFSKEVATADSELATGCKGGPPKSYYQQWLEALEKLMMDKGVVTGDQLRAKKFSLAVSGPANMMTARSTN